MNILIIGGTGKTGRHLINQCLERGLIVTVLVRKPAKLKIHDPNLRIIKGDVLELERMEEAFTGQEAVLCALGHKRYFIRTNILSRGTKNILYAMKKHSIRRLICITALGINDSKFRLGLYYTLFTIPFILYFYFKDKAKQEALIEDSDMDWTIVRPAQFIPGPRRERYKTGPEIGHPIITKLISRADVAHFMLEELFNPSYVRKKPGISY